jgi:hypothetical protein
MNGRVYDPTIARFLSADPHIQAPGNLQSYNRYSYVMNNPLRYTDPSGYFWKKIKRGLSSFWKKNRRGFFKAMFGIVGYNSSTVRNIITGGACIMVPASCGAVIAANAYASGASTSDALKAGARGQIGAMAGQAIAGYAGTNFPVNPAKLGASTGNYIPNVILNGLAGGVQGAINGSGFKNGFTGGAFGAAFKPMNFAMWGTGAANSLRRVITAGLIGGTGSHLSGGNFGYGAFSGAFGQYWNGEAANRRRAQRGRVEPGQEGGVTLAGVSEGAGYAATASLVLPGGQILTAPLTLISLGAGGLDYYFNAQVGTATASQAGQLTLDVVTEATLIGIERTPAGRPVSIGIQIMNHTTDQLTKE